MTRKKVMFWSLELLIVATLIWVCTKLEFLFHPIIVFVSVVFVPLLVSIFLYYMMSPVFRLLIKIHIGKWKLNRGIASLIIVLGLILLIVAAFAVLIPPMIKELNQLIHWLPGAAGDMQNWLSEASQKHIWIKKNRSGCLLQALQHADHQVCGRFAQQLNQQRWLDYWHDYQCSCRGRNGTSHAFLYAERWRPLCTKHSAVLFRKACQRGYGTAASDEQDAFFLHLWAND